MAYMVRVTKFGASLQNMDYELGKEKQLNLGI